MGGGRGIWRPLISSLVALPTTLACTKNFSRKIARGRFRKGYLFFFLQKSRQKAGQKEARPWKWEGPSYE
jgi:hypothetical protein